MYIYIYIQGVGLKPSIWEKSLPTPTTPRQLPFWAGRSQARKRPSNALENPIFGSWLKRGLGHRKICGPPSSLSVRF